VELEFLMDENQPHSTHPEPPPPDEKRWLNRTVLSIGLASFFGDVSYEMANAVLPMLVALIAPGASGAAVLGVVEGLADLISSGAKMASGFMGERLRPRRTIGGLAYLVTGLATTSFALIFSPVLLVVAKSAGWLAKGFRSPLKDALLGDDTHPSNYGKAYGFERMGDTAGAVLGPLLAVLVLTVHGRDNPRPVFWWGLIPAVAAALCMGLGAREHYLLTRHKPGTPWERWRALPGLYKRWLVAVGVFGAGDFAKTMLILWALGKSTLIEHAGFSLLPLLLYAGYNVVGAVTAYVTGALSDRWGRRGLLAGGYALGTLAAVILAISPPTIAAMVLVFTLSGLCVGTEEALEKAYAADFLAPEDRQLGFGVLATVTGIGDFISSSLVGVLWATIGVGAAFGTSAALGAAGTILILAIAPRKKSVAAE
jgi:MFS family permease